MLTKEYLKVVIHKYAPLGKMDEIDVLEALSREDSLDLFDISEVGKRVIGFDGHFWARLLGANPKYREFANKQNVWNLFDAWDWFYLLQRHLEFEKEARAYNTWFDMEEIGLMPKPPEPDAQYMHAEKTACQCDGFNDFDVAQWEIAQWEEILLKYPSSSGKAGIEFEHWKFGKTCGFQILPPPTWVKLLLNHFNTFIDPAERWNAFSKFSSEDWGNLICSLKFNIDGKPLVSFTNSAPAIG